jgi:hypothetical protein
VVFLVTVPLAVIVAAPMQRSFHDVNEAKASSYSQFNIRGTFFSCRSDVLHDVRSARLGKSILRDSDCSGYSHDGPFVWYELNLPSPYFHVKQLFTDKRFAHSSYAALFNYGCTYVRFGLLCECVSVVSRPFDHNQAGLILYFQPLIRAILTPIAGKLSDKIDPRYKLHDNGTTAHLSACRTGY